MANLTVSSDIDSFMQSSSYSGIVDILQVPNSSLTGDIQNGLRKWRAARTKALNGTQFSRINFYGDSLTKGVSASVPIWENSYVGRFRTLWNAQYGLTPGTGICITYTGTQAETDSRFVYSGGGWSFSQTGFLTAPCAVATGATNTLTFTPSETCDTFNVYYLKGSGGGIFGISINGGSVSSIDSSGSGYAKATISASSGSNSLTITAPIVNSCYICGVEATSGSSGVIISRIGVGGTASDALNSEPTLNFELVPPDLSIFAMGVNDFLEQLSVSSLVYNLTSAISTAQQTGDVILEIEVPPGDSETIPWTSYASAIYSLAVSMEIPLINHTSRWGSFLISNPLGLYADSHHPNDDGNSELLRSFTEALIYK